MNGTRIETIVLHSMSDKRQRNLAFQKAASNTRKIILATNIAESSITVPDVKYGQIFNAHEIIRMKRKMSLFFQRLMESILLIEYIKQ